MKQCQAACVRRVCVALSDPFAHPLILLGFFQLAIHADECGYHRQGKLYALCISSSLGMIQMIICASDTSQIFV